MQYQLTSLGGHFQRAVVLAVVLVMELTTRPIWNYVASMESLRNAMLLTATQGSGDEDER